MDNEWKSMKPDAMTSNHNTIIDQLKLKIEIQQATINELSSEMNEMKINFQVQSKLKDHELLNLRRRCEKCQNKVNVLEDNSSSIDQLKFDHLQNIFDMLIKENDSMKRKIKEFVTENDSLVSKLKGKLKHCPVVSFDYGNENCSKPKKLNISEKDGNEDVVDGTVQKVSNANEVQLVYINEKSTKIFEDNIDNKSSEKTIKTSIEIESNPLDKSRNDVICTEKNCCYMTAKHDGQSNIEDILKQVKNKTLTTTVNNNKKKPKPTYNELEARFQFNPICALQELCMSRGWQLPEYRFFEESNFTYSVECTVLTFSVRVEGMLKKIAKRQAAIEMYHKIKNITSRKVLWANDVPEMKLESNGIINDARVFTSAGFHSKPNNIDDKNHVKVNEDSFEMCNKVVNQPVSLEEHGTDPLIVTSKVPRLSENHVPPVNEFVFVNEDKQSLFASVNADLAKILRLSNNPSLRKLKEMKTISKLTVPSNFELLQQIAEEEQLILNYEIIETRTLTMDKNFMGVQLMINDNALKVVGFGETLLEGQEEAAHECLTRFKLFLKD